MPKSKEYHLYQNGPTISGIFHLQMSAISAILGYRIPIFFTTLLWLNRVVLYYKIQSVCVIVCSSGIGLKNHAHYCDEAFAGDSVSLGLGQRLHFILKKIF